MLKMVVEKPMPRANATTAMTVKTRDLLSIRRAKRKSCSRPSNNGIPRERRWLSLVCSRPPSLMNATRRASSGVKPARRLSSMSISRWLASSASSSRSSRSLRNKLQKRWNHTRRTLIGFHSLVAQRDQGINAGGSAGGQIAGEKAGGEQCQRSQDERSGIECRNAPELRLQNAYGKKCNQQAEEEAAADQQNSLAKYQRENVAALGSQSHAYAKFLRLQRDRIGHDAEQTDQSEAEANPRAGAKGNQAKFRFHILMRVQQSFQRIGVGKNWIGVHISKYLPESIDEQVWISCRAYQDIAIAETAESIRNKGFRLDGLLQTDIPEITDDAHDFKIGIVRSSGNLIENIEFNLLADGILVREILIGQRLIDYGDAARQGHIGRRDQSSTQQARTQGLEISFTAGFKTSSP